MQKSFIIAAVMLSSQPAFALTRHIMPQPKSVQMAEGNGFAIGRSINITDPTSSVVLAEFLSDAGLAHDPAADASLTVSLGNVTGSEDYVLAGYPDEAYQLTVRDNAIDITAPTAVGVIRAVQTLRIMLQECDGVLENVTVTDWPAFKLRGFMHDVGRSFLPVDELKREIDLLSRFKVNTFHWHLTDNTGWRLQIEAYPQLTGSAAITRYPGMYYSKEDAKMLQDYAAERGMVIIPEIDVPGHSGPFERAMGHSMQTPAGIAGLKVILAEVAELFDKAPYIHIGGDEKSFSDSYLIDMIDYVHSLGKKVVIWNRYNSPAKPVDPSVIPCDLTTNWATAGALTPGVPNIDMRYNYTNHFDLFADVVGIFKSNIFGAVKGNEDIAGTISAAWNDTKTPTPDDIVRQNNVYANILASCERAWTGGGRQYIEQGGVTLPSSGSEYDEFVDWERRFLYHKTTTMAATAGLIPYVRQSDVRWMVTEQMPNGGDASASLPPEEYIDADEMPASFIIGGDSYRTNIVTGAGIYLRHIWHPTVKGFYESPSDNMTAYAWTYIYSPCEQDAGALIEFYTYSRSGNEKGPERGRWDRRGSRVWLNGAEIPAPEWQQPGANIRQDQTTAGLANENVTARPPVTIHLKEGWNKVFLKLPHVNSGGTARDKWQFTFVVTDADGADALDGIVYSPRRMLDTETERLIMLMDEVSAWRADNIGDTPGFYPESMAADLDRIMAEIQPTLSESPDAGVRVAQMSELSSAFNAVKDAASRTDVMLPADGAVYKLSTPLRDGLYVTGKGTGVALAGVLVADNYYSQWQFTLRDEGTYDIICAGDGTYVSPDSPYNSALVTVADRPSHGWRVSAADATGYLIITNGAAQWNQTNASYRYKIFNWGSGTNVSDSGCKFRFTPVVPSESGVNIIREDMVYSRSKGIYDLSGRRFADQTRLPRGFYIVDGKKVFIK